ncbi:hypothetical protein [Natronomonas marina]|uniref:hypothetical protein n=1 Tax=Natronomonas marina TaxID=2961939 RepID=UPI0020C93ACD|nr:hypothetical protein [Natronomonas marina]
MTADPPYLVCPACEHSQRLDGGDEAADDEGTTCPECGSARAYRHHESALPDAASEAYVKLDAETAEET